MRETLLSSDTNLVIHQTDENNSTKTSSLVYKCYILSNGTRMLPGTRANNIITLKEYGNLLVYYENNIHYQQNCKALDLYRHNNDNGYHKTLL